MLVMMIDVNDNLSRDSWGKRCFMVHLRLLKPEPFQVIFDADDIDIGAETDEVDSLLH